MNTYHYFIQARSRNKPGEILHWDGGPYRHKHNAEQTAMDVARKIVGDLGHELIGQPEIRKYETNSTKTMEDLKA